MNNHRATRPSTAYLFVDTNFLIQCRQPKDLDWSFWKDFTEVRLIVSKPVLREIDSLKNRGNERRARRARTASANFRRMRPSGQEVVHASGPRVLLSVEPHHNRSAELDDQLDYRERDEQLVGTIYGFAKANPQAHVCLLTHDTTPTYIAEGLGLTYKLIPDEWLLPPENTKVEKELSALRVENERLRRAEPSFKVRCVDETGKTIKKLECGTRCYEPLAPAELESLLDRLRQTFPQETDFGPREPEEKRTDLFGTLFLGTRVFKPATEEEIAAYSDKAYPEWIERCERILAKCYEAPRQSQPPSFSFLAANRGTRSARNALVTIEVEGNFLIMPADREEADEAFATEPQELLSRLPRPPAAPTGEWRYTGGPLAGLEEAASALDAARIVDAIQNVEHFAEPPTFDAQGPFLPSPHDPNGFYYQESRPTQPTRRICLVCDQWRHMAGEECFAGRIIIRPDQSEVRGAMFFRIHAENLSDPVSRPLPVRIDVDRVSSLSRARLLVDEICGDHGESDLSAESLQKARGLGRDA